MKNKNGYTIVELIVLIVVLGIATFITINRVSYALSDDKSEVYKMQVKLIETQAQVYGNTIKEELKNEGKTITVNTLVAENYLEADDDKGKVYDARDEMKTLNDKKIKISYNAENDTVEAKLIEK